MTKKQINRYIVSVLIVLLVISAGFFLSRYVRTQAQTSVNTKKMPERLQETAAPRQVVEFDQPEWRQNVSLQTLGAESTVIVIGKAIRNSCRQSPTEALVTTDYEIEVQEIIRLRSKETAQIDCLVA